jgi:hypothetical protein
MNAYELYQIVTESLRAACTSGELEWSVLAEWDRQWVNCQQKLPLLEAKVQDLEGMRSGGKSGLVLRLESR